MLFKTEGVVINYIKYSETSIITKIYTSAFGIQSFIVNGIRNKNSKNKIEIYQTLTLLDLVVYHKPNSSLNRISEIKCQFPFKSIPYEQKKTGIALFISEALNKTLKEQEGNEELFLFIKNAIISLDNNPINFENFHLQFLLKLSSYLGFSPSSIDDVTKPEIPIVHDLDEEEILQFENLFNADLSQSTKISGRTRKKILDLILHFYRTHHENFGEMKSLKVLRELMNS